MKTTIAPNGMKIIYNESDEHRIQRFAQKAQESIDIKNAKREEKQKEYFLRIRARYEAWEAKKAKASAAAEVEVNAETEVKPNIESTESVTADE